MAPGSEIDRVRVRYGTMNDGLAGLMWIDGLSDVTTRLHASRIVVMLPGAEVVEIDPETGNPLRVETDDGAGVALEESDPDDAAEGGEEGAPVAPPPAPCGTAEADTDPGPRAPTARKPRTPRRRAAP
jgi:hypothetical protein